MADPTPALVRLPQGRKSLDRVRHWPRARCSPATSPGAPRTT